MAASHKIAVRPNTAGTATFAPGKNDEQQPAAISSGPATSTAMRRAAASRRRLSIYAEHFQLIGEPFSLTPDPSFLYPSPCHAEALAALKIGLQDRRGLLAMTGEVGTGKTTLLYSLLSELGSEIHTAYISNTKLQVNDLLRQALADFGAPCDCSDKLVLLESLNGFLRDCAARGATAALVIDEAQNLDDDAFENIRLLSNFETFSSKLLQIVLVGQPELHARLARPSVRQIAERIAVRCEITPLSPEEGRRYIEHRLECAGGSIAMFTPDAIRLALRHSGGLPRRINILCHNAMLFAYGRRVRRVTRREVQAAVRERETATRPSPAAVSAHRFARWRRNVILAGGGALLAAAGIAAAWWNASPTRFLTAPQSHLTSPVFHRPAPRGALSGTNVPQAFGTALDVDTGYSTGMPSRTSNE